MADDILTGHAEQADEAVAIEGKDSLKAVILLCHRIASDIDFLNSV